MLTIVLAPESTVTKTIVPLTVRQGATHLQETAPTKVLITPTLPTNLIPESTQITTALGMLVPLQAQLDTGQAIPTHQELQDTIKAARTMAHTIPTLPISSIPA